VDHLANNAKQNGAEVKVTRAQLVDYIKATATDSPDAPLEGGTFIQDTAGTERVYLRVEGLAAHLGIEGRGKVRRAIVEDHGFTRRPFTYQHPEKGQTSASYFSRPTQGLKGLAKLPRRPVRSGKGSA
jgi:hypothetical protein